MKKLMVLVFCLGIAICGSSFASAQTIPNWEPNTAYAVGALVMFNGVEYKCIQAHTSQVGWEPPNTPALWQSVSGSPSPTPTPSPTPSPTPKPTPTPTPSGGGGSCAPAWNATTAYTGGMVAAVGNNNYTAAFWTQNQNPTLAGNSGPAGSGAPWSLPVACSGGSPTPTPTPTPKPTPTPTPTPTPSPSPTPSPTSGNGLPKHLLMGYWQDFNNGATCLTIAQVPTMYNVIAVAFANATSTPGQVTFSVDSGLSACIPGGYTAAQFTNDIATAHSRGQKVIISVGGANGTISVTDSISASNFATSVHQLIATYGFDGVDIDLENGVNPSVMASALQQLASMNPGVIITMAPQTTDVQSPSSDYLALALNISSILTIMNTQYYNSGSMNGCDGNVYAEGGVNFFTALACIQLKTSLNPDQIGLGAPASSSAAGSGVVAPSIVVDALDCLASGKNCGTFVPPTQWPAIRGAMTWSINWDASNGYNFAKTVSAGLSSLP
jgi:chitinase